MTIPVFHSYGNWFLSGVSTWTVNQIRSMRNTGFDCKILFTGIPRSFQDDLDDIDIPYDFIDVPDSRKRQHEWLSLKRYLEDHAPCIYITNFDFHRSCAVGTLHPSVRIIVIIHSDEECYFDELRRIGSNCNAIVCVSSYLTSQAKLRFPALVDRIHYIPYGIPLPGQPIPPKPIDGPLRLCYCNRIQQYQKRVFDLPLIAQKLEELAVNYEFDIAGDGADFEELHRRFAKSSLKSTIRFHGRLTNQAVMDIFRRSHVFLLTSDFEGLPISLMEAMSVGCFPVAYHIDSGIKDAIPSAAYGALVTHANTNEFAAAIKEMDGNRYLLHELAENAQNRIRTHFSLEAMAESYNNLFESLFAEGDSLLCKRSGIVAIPFELSFFGRLRRKLRLILERRSQFDLLGLPGIVSKVIERTVLR